MPQLPRESHGSFTCDICGLVLSRASHVPRHRRLHLPTGQQNTFTCDQCGKSFSRKDIFLRHNRMTHQPRDRSTKTRRKSCLRCVENKLKCSRSHPCITCGKRNIECLYLPADTASDSFLVVRERDVLFPELEEGVPRPSITYDYPDASRNNATSADEACIQRVEEGALPEPALSQSFPSSISMNQAISNNPDVIQPWNDISKGGPSHAEVEMYDNPGTGIPETGEGAAINLVTQDDAPHNPNQDLGSVHPPCYRLQGPNDFGFTELDWLNWELSSPEGLHFEAGHTTEGTSSSHQNRDQMSEVCALAGSKSQEAFQQTSHQRYMNDDCAGDIDSPQLPKLRMTREQWPFDYTPTSMARKVQLPPLRQILESSVRPRRAINRANLTSLIELLSSPYLPPVDESLDLHIMPAFVLLTKFLNLYLTDFNSVIPIIHVPTWEILTCPTVLLAAMACIGACFSDAEGSLEFSGALSEISLQSLSWLGGSDSTNYRDPAFVSACCLHQIYSLGSGNHRLYENADRSRGILVTSLRGMGMLRSRLSGENNGDGLGLYNGKARSPTEWLRWRSEEMERRITWASFEYDCSLCTLTNRRGAVDLHELPSRLPCADALWEAPSAQAWSALASRATPNMMGTFLPRLLSDIFAQKPIPSEVPAWGRRLCSQVIGRLLWDLKQIEVLSMSDFLGLPSLTAAHKPTRDVLVRCLSNLCDSMSQPSCTADLIHLNITSLICHYSHLYTSEEAMDLVVYIFRGAVRDRSKQLGSDLEFAKQRLAVVLAKNPRDTRAMVGHAAQIIAVAREYFIHAPCETLRVFMGHILILAVAKHGHRALSSNATGMSVRLDQPIWRADQKVAISRWIEEGGPASIGSVEDICDPSCLGALKLDALQMMHKMRIWGLARKFYKVLGAFDTEGD